MPDAKPIVSRNRLCASARAQRNEVGSGSQSGGNLGGVAGGNDHVVVFAFPKTTEHGSGFLRLHPRPEIQGRKRRLRWGPIPARGGGLDTLVGERAPPKRV